MDTMKQIACLFASGAIATIAFAGCQPATPGDQLKAPPDEASPRYATWPPAT